MKPVDVIKGTSPLVLGQPHGGTYVPEDIFEKLNERGQGLDDTDWHISRLYDGLSSDITVVKATFHRYVIDANRDPSGRSLYPGQNTTTLCPVTDFDGNPIWREGCAPGDMETDHRRINFHQPYHAALSKELERIRQIHGFAILYDCHSIRSHIPFLFDGRLPVFNTGTNNGETCAERVETAVTDICRSASGFDHILNGRFKGGWTTRHYGRPDQGLHAIQMELAQRCYMEEQAPWNFREDRAEQIRPFLGQILNSLKELDLSPSS